MDLIGAWLETYPWIALIASLIVGYPVYRLVRWALARLLYRIAVRSESVYDDLVVDHLHPFRFAWLVPLSLNLALFYATVGPGAAVSKVALLLTVVAALDLAFSLLAGFNAVYEHSPTYTGRSVAAYIDLAKLLAVAGVIILSLVLLTDLPPSTLLAGVGAWLAVLLLIFQNTILNLVAAIQISTLDTIKAGDWIEVPEYGAEGTVVDVALNFIRVRNSDMTTTLIPTHKIATVRFKNFRGVPESGGRRLKSAIVFDTRSVRFSDEELLERLESQPFIGEMVRDERAATAADAPSESGDTRASSRFATTNLEWFRRYAESFLKARNDIRQRRFTFIVRVLDPSPAGMPLEIYVFAKKTDFVGFEKTRGEILLHLVAAAAAFDLEFAQA